MSRARSERTATSHSHFHFQEHLDYEIIQSLNPEFNKAVVRVNIFKEHRQTIQVNETKKFCFHLQQKKKKKSPTYTSDVLVPVTQQYIHPGDAVKLGQAELLVIDEAAAIPLPLVKKLLGPYLVFMSSTINGSVLNTSPQRHFEVNCAVSQTISEREALFKTDHLYFSTLKKNRNP